MFTACTSPGNPCSDMHSQNEIVVVGAGLVGSLLALMLKNKGFKVTVYERYGNMTQIPSGLKSINLIMTRRGLVAADELGVGEGLRDLGVQVTGRVMHQSDGSEVFQKYGSDSDVNYSVSRYELNCFLIRRLEALNVPIHWNHALKKVDYGLDSNTECVKLEFSIEMSEKLTAVKLSKHTPIIGADGGPSAVRYCSRDAGLLDFKEEILPQGYKEIIFPGREFHFNDKPSTSNVSTNVGTTPTNSKSELPAESDTDGTGATKTSATANTTTADLGFSAPDLQKDVKTVDNGYYCMEPSGLHIWPRKTHMLMGLADKGDGSGKRGTFTGTIYVDNDKWPKNNDEVTKFFEEHYPTAIPLLGGIESIQKQMLEKPAGLLGTVRATNYNIKGGRGLILGDAAHAIVPFFGQGCNSGFEDVAVLSSLLSNKLENSIHSKSLKFEDDFAPIFLEFNKQRKTSADAIANLALENFVEMRASVGNEFFLKMKHIEKALENEYPTMFRSRYAMVCYGSAMFGNITYHNALQMTQVLSEIITELVNKIEKEIGHEYLYKSDSNAVKGYIENNAIGTVKDEASFQAECEKQKDLVLKLGREMIDCKGKLGLKLNELGMDLKSMIGAR